MIAENIAYVAQELARGAPAADRPAMLENIAKALTKHLLQDNPGIGAREAIGARYGGKSGNSDSLMTESRGLSAK